MARSKPGFNRDPKAIKKILLKDPGGIAALRAAGWQTPDSAANFVWLRAEPELHARLMAAFDAADILVRGYPGDGIRVSLADAATNDRVLAVLADRSRFGSELG